MARLGDIPQVLRSVGAWGFLKRVWEQVGQDNLLAWAAALAYSWLFAIFPFLIFLMSLLPYLPEDTKESAKLEIYTSCYQYMPRQAADTIWNNLTEILSRPRTGLLGIGLLLS